MKKTLATIISTLFLAWSGSWADGTDYDLTIRSVRVIGNSSNNGSATRGIFLYLEGNKTYRYLFESPGNSMESGRTLLAILLAAHTSGRNINVGYMGSSPSSNGTTVEMQDVTIR